MELEETRLANGMFRWASKDILKPRDLTPPEKIKRDRKMRLLAEKAMSRQEVCWLCEERKASAWIAEVGFDFKGERAAPVDHIAISSADYPGPVPGFCMFCMASGPVKLAEAVYFDRPEMYWGVRPTRWFVVFTDGTIHGDQIVTIDPKQELPKIVEEFLSNGNY